MKKTTSSLFILIILLVSMQLSEATMTASPSSLRIPRGSPNSRTITYYIRSFDACTQGISPNGIFYSGIHSLGTVNIPLSIALTGSNLLTTGSVAETLTIPVGVINRAERLGVNQFSYRRIFNMSGCQTGGAPERVDIQIALTGEETAPFGIHRIQIYFENKRAEITLKRHQPLKAFVDVRFVGSGLLRGYWEIDGVRRYDVQKHLSYAASGGVETFESPDLSPHFTFVTGTHIVRFVVTNPTVSIPFPEALYFVMEEEFKKIGTIRLLAPKDKSKMDYVTPNFQWEAPEPSVTYLIEFLEEGGEKPIFSAYVKKPQYSLPPRVFRNLFSPGKGYQWRVKGFDFENNIIAESPLFKFTFKERASYLPGQILLVTDDSQQIERIGKKFNLLLVEDFEIQSLHLKGALFQTEKDIFKLISEILKEEGVILAQPNYILRTMGEPMSEMHNLYRILNLKKVHETLRGKGIIVAIIDTGVDTQHRDLKDRVISSENLLKEPFKAEVHGTAVAGIIGASLNGFGIEGIAPEAQIIALRACKQVSEDYPEGECYTSTVARALDIAIQRKTRIVNMSFGSLEMDRLLLKLIEEGAKKGILFVAPVGNIPGQKEIAFPASHPAVIAVAGVDEKGNLYPNSEIASKARVCAPAFNILTTIPGDKHNFLSGTSLSSASVTGILAIGVEKNGSVEKDKLPPFRGNICRWEEDLLNLPLCEK